MDTSRQWPVSINDITTHHQLRYEFAASRCSGRVLDAACGAGYGSAIIHELCDEVVGIDKSEAAIAWAKRYFSGPKFICSEIEKEPWSGSFDTVVSLETIEHVKEPAPLLDIFRRVCNGYFIASVPNEDNYRFKAENFQNDESPHFRHYTPSEFQDLLDSHGFSVVEKFRQISKSKPWVVPGTDGAFLIYVCR